MHDIKCIPELRRIASNSITPCMLDTLINVYFSADIFAPLQNFDSLPHVFIRPYLHNFIKKKISQQCLLHGEKVSL